MHANDTNISTRTKIVATLGPASWELDALRALVLAGVDVFRINCSHADRASIARQVARVRQVAAEVLRPIAILLDLQGPKIRTGEVAQPLELRDGSVLTIVMDEHRVGSGHTVGTTWPEMVDDVVPGTRILFDDGAIYGFVSHVRRDSSPPEVDIRIDHGGFLRSHKGINLPEIDMRIPSLTEKDVGDIHTGLDVGVDYIALSFVRSGDDVRELRDLLHKAGHDIPIIAKIEKPQALQALEDILDVAQGVMVARGDLGVEVPIENVPVYQKKIIATAAKRGKLIITATQMLDSMERNPRPTRAETTDVANAIFDGTDAVMLSGETSVGLYPVEAVRVMDGIARFAEASPFFKPTALEDLPALGGPTGSACRAAAYALIERPRPVLVFSMTGATARYISKLRPKAPIYAMSPNATVVDQLALAWGVIGFLIPFVETFEALLDVGVRMLKDAGFVRDGEEIIVVGGNSPREGTTTFVKFHVVTSGNGS